MTQAALARAVGVDIRTVQGWESGRRPRGKAAREVERVLGIDLDPDPEGTSPRLNEATDGQLATELMSRLVDRDAQIQQLNRALTEVGRSTKELA